MTRKILTLLIVPTIAALTLLALPNPVHAAPPGHGGGGFHGGSFHGGGAYHGGYYGGSHYGYYPHSSYGYHNYGYRSRPFIGYGYGYPYYYGSGLYPYSYGSGYYPYYGYSSGYTPYYDTAPSYTVDPGAVPAASDTIAPMNLPTTSENNSSNGQEATPSSTEATSNTAKITVHLPNADANLWIDGTMMNGTGMDRVFVTPTLTTKQKYTYEIRTRWLDGDTTIDQTRKVIFSPGDKVDVRFPPATAK
jgi:uncharacterized protein (TIGR03000 family)